MATQFTEQDRWLFNGGRHFELGNVLGAHLDGDATSFRVWAPNADAVSVVGDFNGWNPESHTMHPSESGVWEITIPGVGQGTKYKYSIQPKGGGRRLEKADPIAIHAETPPQTASVVWGRDYEWGDDDYMSSRGDRLGQSSPVSIYECHLGSWTRQGGRNYRDLAAGLIPHLALNGFTHIELMPVMEHPFDGSWGYQTTGLYAPTSRFGTPQDFMAFVDMFHQAGIGVILDWVPSHFAVDAHGLARFDGTHLYEHADPRQGYHPDWGSYIFNYGRNEVRSFLLSSAHHWFDLFHIDALRVDAVASMLYLDYSRNEGEWIPNVHGGNENLEAVTFLQELNESVYGRFPGIQMIAEESTAWPLVTRPVDVGGLGFGYKWDMGWMNDTLRYFANDPIYRSFEDQHRMLTFRAIYAFTENYILALSHDEVVHGKKSLLDKHPGDEWKRYASYRAMLAYQWALPGKKLLFMGAEIADPREWDHNGELPFHLLDYPVHAGVMRLVGELNRMYRDTPALHVWDTDARGFQWIEADDISRASLVFLRSAEGHPPVVAVCNFTPEAWHDYRIGVPAAGAWKTLLCTDADEFGGSGLVPTDLQTIDEASHGHDQSLQMLVPPMSVTFLTPD